MEKYDVWLDESGNFAQDLNPSTTRNPSLIGGFFSRRRDMPSPDPLVDRIHESLEQWNHATDLDSRKGEIMYERMYAAKSYPIEFVIFQNLERQKIVSPTQTYLTMMTEGLIQLLKTLVVRENAPVELNVTAGYKKEPNPETITSFVEGYVSLEQYLEPLKERITIEKARLRNELLKKSEIRFCLGDDKRDKCLILCDSICNFWYTNQSAAFRHTVRRNGAEYTIRELLLKLYDSRFVYSLFSQPEQDHILQMTRDGMFADALFESCTGLISAQGRKDVLSGFLTLPPKQISRQLGNLADYIGDLLLFGKERELIAKVLDNADKLSGALADAGKQDRKFALDVGLYRLAFMNRYGLYEEMEELFRQLEPEVARYTARTMDMDYLIIYYVRRAVFLQDQRRYRESCEICESMDALLGLISMALQSNDRIAFGEELHSEQIGKVLGTKLQAQIALCALGEETPDAARVTSDRAMEQFVFEQDMIRQYQYRAELEAVSGNLGDAISWLERSFGGKPWREYITAPQHGIFDVYNLAFAAAFTAGSDPTGGKIAEQLYKSCLNEIRNFPVAREECLLLLGCGLLGGKLDAKGRSLLTNLADQGTGKAEAASKILHGSGAKAVFQ